MRKSIILAPLPILAIALVLGACKLPTNTETPGADTPLLSSQAVTNDTTPTWTWPPAANATGYRVRLDSQSAAWIELSSESLSWTPPNALSDGTHVLYAQAKNSAGVWSATGSFSATIDTLAPASPSVQALNPTNESRPLWTWTLPQDAKACRYQLDAELPEGWTEAPTSTLSWTPSTDFANDSTHSLYVAAKDEAGNWSASSFVVVSIDTSLLDPPVVSGPTTVYEASATWTWGAVSGAAAYRWSLDSESGTWTEATNTTLSHSDASLSAGSHRLYVQTQNSTGKWSGSGSWTVTVVLEKRIRLMAANLTSGNGQDYTDEKGLRIMQGCAPDVVMIQEFAYKANAPAEYQEMANRVIYGTASPATPAYYWQEGGGHSIPNGIISKYPILASGEWDDTYLLDRDFVWARIDIPGSIDLWVVSVHIKASSGSTDKEKRTNEATLLKSYVAANVPAQAYFAIGGDFNTYSSDSASEPCLGVFDDMVVATGPYPADRNGNVNTNTTRASPYDRVLVDADLEAYKTPVVIGSSSFPNGLIADTRVYSPISEIAPALVTDSDRYLADGVTATNMQHMAVVRDFLVPVGN